MQAAMLRVKLKHLVVETQRRKEIALAYAKGITIKRYLSQYQPTAQMSHWKTMYSIYMLFAWQNAMPCKPT
ncbi:hypothetical protein HSBAA_19200 [Vreelandella sulfidaeris]|uniref:Uncharacterized protein n=1 Tax=Vreelandella sulfidaeris TaxID=115553 RepID=A0A455UBK4_9GAMM|nr:hypothetical protein HSBAA_19200 [Halomonas sulfidaeris]